MSTSGWFWTMIRISLRTFIHEGLDVHFRLVLDDDQNIPPYNLHPRRDSCNLFLRMYSSCWSWMIICHHPRRRPISSVVDNGNLLAPRSSRSAEEEHEQERRAQLLQPWRTALQPCCHSSLPLPLLLLPLPLRPPLLATIFSPYRLLCSRGCLLLHGVFPRLAPFRVSLSMKQQ